MIRPVAVVSEDLAWVEEIHAAAVGLAIAPYQPERWPDARAHALWVDGAAPLAGQVTQAPAHCPVIVQLKEGPDRPDLAAIRWAAVTELWGRSSELPPAARRRPGPRLRPPAETGRPGDACRRMSELLEGVSPPPSLSACILTTGDEVRLDACLRSIEGVVDEIVVQVDARQPGAAAQVAARFTDRVVVETPPLFECEPPRIDFASARNRGLDLATGDWVLVIDADEQLSDGAFLREAVAHAAWGKMDGVGVRVECVTDRGLAEAATSIRAFRRCDRIRWRYPVHNQLVGVRNALSSGAVIRSSYEGAGALDARVARAVPALRAMYALAEPEAPERAHAAFYLCRSYAAVHDHWRTIEWGRRCAELCGDHSSVAPFWLWLAEAELHTSGPDAAGAVVDEGLARHPDLADLWHMRMGLDLMRWTDAASRTLAGASPFGTVPQRSLPHAARALDAARLLGLPISTNLGAPLPGSPSAHNPDDQAPVA